MWQVAPECTPDLTLDLSTNVLVDMETILSHVSEAFNSSKLDSLGSRLSTQVASQLTSMVNLPGSADSDLLGLVIASSSGKPAANPSSLSEIWIKPFLVNTAINFNNARETFREDLKTNGYVAVNTTQIHLEDISQMLSQALPGVDVKFCSYTTPTELVVGVDVSVTLALDVEMSFGDDLIQKPSGPTGAVFQMQSAMNSTLKFAGTRRRLLSRTDAITFDGISICKKDWVYFSAAESTGMHTSGSPRYLHALPSQPNLPPQCAPHNYTRLRLL